MVKVKIILILTIALVALTALSGMASAFTVNVDHIQRNGYYTGTPVLLKDEIYHYGYNYTFNPDGTYTLFGTITNEDSTPVTVIVQLSDGGASTDLQLIEVPAATGSKSGSVALELTTKTPWFFKYYTSAADQNDHITLNVLHAYDVTDEPDTTIHTLNQGPMSDAVAIFSNGKITYNGQPAYTISLGL